MKTIITVLAIAMLFASCATEKYCMNRYPQTPVVNTRVDSFYKEVIRYRDTNMKAPVPAGFDSSSKPIDTASHTSDTTKAQTSVSTAKAWVENNRVNLQLQNKDTTINVLLKNAIRERDMYKQRYEQTQITKVQIKYEVPWWLWLIVGAGAIFSFFIGWRAKAICR